jgi:hypothetical protein
VGAKALEIYPENLVPINQKGLYLCKLGQFKKSTKNTKKAGKLFPRIKNWDMIRPLLILGRERRCQYALNALEKIPKPERYEHVMTANQKLGRKLNIYYRNFLKSVKTEKFF